MSLESVLARVSQIETMFSTAQSANATSAASAVGTTAADATSLSPGAAPATSADFATLLQSAQAPTLADSALSPTDATTPVAATTTGGTSAADAIVNIAQSQVGQGEQPPGSNDGPAIATYRSATQGAIAGDPWCAYFVSWAARQAGEPIGSQGQGLGYVGDIWTWAQQTGRAIPNGPGVVPQPGDLIVFGDQHVGIVKQVLPNGSIETIEGNYANQVENVIRSPGEATGYVRM